MKGKKGMKERELDDDEILSLENGDEVVFYFSETERARGRVHVESGIISIDDWIIAGHNGVAAHVRVFAVKPPAKPSAPKRPTKPSPPELSVAYDGLTFKDGMVGDETLEEVEGAHKELALALKRYRGFARKYGWKTTAKKEVTK